MLYNWQCERSSEKDDDVRVKSVLLDLLGLSDDDVDDPAHFTDSD